MRGNIHTRRSPPPPNVTNRPLIFETRRSASGLVTELHAAFLYEVVERVDANVHLAANPATRFDVVRYSSHPSIPHDGAVVSSWWATTPRILPE